MKRQVRRFSKTIRNKISDAGSYTRNLVRSRSDYYYSHHNTHTITRIPTPVSDTEEDDPVFGAIPSDELSTDDTTQTAVMMLPCEFCSSPQSAASLNRHQLVCLQNPAYSGRRRNLTTDSATDRPRRRVVSDYASPPPTVPRRIRSPTPSAPPRSRTPSPTDGFSAPSHLICPITLTVFRDPVVASDGHTYERAAIVNCLRSSKASPMTRGPISADKLNSNLIIKELADNFRTECRQKKLLYKYRLDVDVKKLEPIADSKTNKKTSYQAEWIKTNSSSTNTKILLTHYTGENAEELAEMNCQLELHPNIVRTLGRVAHKEPGILLVQEYSSEQTLAQFLKQTDRKKLSITILDTILYQIASALQHLASFQIIHGNVTAENVFIYQFDELPENILVKLTNIGDVEKSTDNIDIEKIAPEVLASKERSSEKSDVYAFGILTRELYSFELATNDADINERQMLIETCLAPDPNERPTFNELTKSLVDLMHNKKFIFPSLSE